MLLIKLIMLMVINVFFITANAAVLKDPTRPVAASNGGGSVPQRLQKNKLTLNVIKLDKNQKVAVINGKVYRQGQHVGQDRIIKVLLDKVIFSSGKELYLFGHSVVSVSQ